MLLMRDLRFNSILLRYCKEAFDNTSAIGAVRAFTKGIVLRLAALDKFELSAFFFAPVGEDRRV